MSRLNPLRGSEAPSNFKAILVNIATIRTCLDFRSKGDRGQVDHGRLGIMRWSTRFDYEHEHRFTEHEHDIGDRMLECWRATDQPETSERVMGFEPTTSSLGS